MALGPTVILRALTCLDKSPETGGFSRVLGAAGMSSLFIYYGDGDQLMKWANRCCCNFFSLLCVKRLLLYVTPLLRYDTPCTM